MSNFKSKMEIYYKKNLCLIQEIHFFLQKDIRFQIKSANFYEKNVQLKTNHKFSELL